MVEVLSMDLSLEQQQFVAVLVVVMSVVVDHLVAVVEEVEAVEIVIAVDSMLKTMASYLER